MFNGIEERSISCPYCGETIEILIDCSVPRQSYIEDCQVCCRPINVDVMVDNQNDDIQLTVSNENE